MKIVFDGLVKELPITPSYVGCSHVHIPGKVNLEAIALTHSIEEVPECFADFEDILLYQFVGKKVRLTVQG
jgi:hypothetical protein